MNVSTSKISNVIYDAETPRVNTEVRTAVLVWIISLLVTGLLAFTVCQLGITPA
jgi:hypothetical protein